jgi:N-acetyl-anhydromuramyl-L-alanine amidase AmpD
MSFSINEHLIPFEPGQAISRGWTQATQLQPKGVTWHWTATRDLATCRRVIGGAQAERKGIASAHYCVGQSFAEGADLYVSIEDRSWHAGMHQTLRWDGKSSDQNTKGSRATIGVETVNIGYARPGFPAGANWLKVASADNRRIMQIPPWPAEQIQMMIAIGRTIVNRWNHIGIRDHHGHHDICPGYKDDVAGFPFAEVLSGIYNQAVPDIWTPLALPIQRQNALHHLGYKLGDTGPKRNGVDGLWGKVSDRVLMQFQRDNGLVPNGMWSTFVSWNVQDRLLERQIDIGSVGEVAA